MSILMISLIAGLSILTVALAVLWILAAPKPRGWNEYRQASRATREATWTEASGRFRDLR